MQTSVFAAFIGALASLFYLCKYYFKNYQNEFDIKLISLTKIFKLTRLTLLESIPFLLVGSGITITQLIDQVFFKQIMNNLLGYSLLKTQYVYTLFSANPNKITTVIIALATSISETSLPLLAANKKEKIKIKSLISQNTEYILLVLLPITIILISTSYNINCLFYENSILGSRYLQLNILQALIMALGINGLTVLQGLRYSKKAMAYMCIGILIKLILQYTRFASS